MHQEKYISLCIFYFQKMVKNLKESLRTLKALEVYLKNGMEKQA